MFRNFGLAARRKGTRNDNVGALRIEPVELRAFEQRQQHRRFGSDHHNPSGGTIGARECLDDFHAGGHINIEACVTFGDEHAEASGCSELREQIEGESAAGVDLGAA